MQAQAFFTPFLVLRQNSMVSMCLAVCSRICIPALHAEAIQWPGLEGTGTWHVNWLLNPLILAASAAPQVACEPPFLGAFGRAMAYRANISASIVSDVACPPEPGSGSGSGNSSSRRSTAEASEEASSMTQPLSSPAAVLRRWLAATPSNNGTASEDGSCDGNSAMDLIVSLRVPNNDTIGAPRYKQMLLGALDLWQQESAQAAGTNATATPTSMSVPSQELTPQPSEPPPPPPTQGLLPLRVCAPPEEAVEVTVEAAVLYSVPLNDQGVAVYANVCGQQAEWASTSTLLTGGATAQCNLQAATSSQVGAVLPATHGLTGAAMGCYRSMPCLHGMHPS